MIPDSLVLFLVSSTLLVLTPGPDMLNVLVRALGQGRRAGLVTAAGVSAGILVHTAGAALGLAAVLAASASAFTVIKLVGAVYLVLAGLQALFGRLERLDLSGETRILSMRRLFSRGFLINVLNPKVALFFLAFLPQFISSPDQTGPEMLLFGLLYALLTLLLMSLIGWGAAAARQAVLGRSRVAAILQRGSGLLFLGFGLRLAVADS
ncbi:MAG TPA: LysE family translocator [Desulfomicrobiaceae bacterium]|nr:LysE family translocator [Desulfomicrobiaceae bacterium]